MANFQTSLLTLALLVTTVATPLARGEGLTREQVKAELAESTCDCVTSAQACTRPSHRSPRRPEKK
jgi:hypothetical protein